ncbi:hypothetical protein GZH47_11145 [Paenibacillus rhizovicinus]|uniref:Uncharacterized protein n=1 Tax=Paenibacillus rhizovicinus TaxID=2704463 RepID=A0A6C0NYN5_9BACL|nr:hypothetical protein [Paenibacillus rhizovicinus]QHW31345.1 hypothetical protein GZH47_11145 [Paenibacillus rhizovicinus]
MKEDKIMQPTELVKLGQYRFSGLDASLVGAMKSAADYYRMPLTAAWIYGMTGLAFLHVLDENMAEPNGGPLEPEVFRLARNIGLDIQGIHVYAEGETFARLQAEAWEKAKQAMYASRPVFAKNIDIRNQTSVIHAIDDTGYYTYTWHTGYEHSEEVIPWNLLGLSRCPCIHCVLDRQSSATEEVTDSSAGLISLHWTNPIQAADEEASFKEALEFVIRLNEKAAFQWSGRTYLVGSKAYEHWLTAVENRTLDKYMFSLFVEILTEARNHAVAFLAELRGVLKQVNPALVDELMLIYSEMASEYQILKGMYPYSEPREHELTQHERCAEILRGIMALEAKATVTMMGIYETL